MPRPPVDAKLDKFVDKLGKFPDQDIADLAEVSRTAVVNFRKRKGIEPYAGYKFLPGGGQAPVPPAPLAARPILPIVPRVAAPVVAPTTEPTQQRAFAGRPSKLGEYADQLGKVPDAEIAAQAGTSVENVRAYRARRGIEASTRAAAALPEAAREAALPAPAPAVGTQIAFAVTADVGNDARSYVVVAADIVSAARAAVELVAARHANGSVKGVVRVAEVL